MPLAASRINQWQGKKTRPEERLFPRDATFYIQLRRFAKPQAAEI